MRIVAVLILAALPLAAFGQDRAFRLELPDDLVTAGFDKHLLTRFRFKTRVSVTPVSPGTDAEAALLPDIEGTRVFTDDEGQIWRVARRDDPDGHVQTFVDWLRSDPGRAAVESFSPGGTPLFSTSAPAAEAAEVEVFKGDTETGSRLALVHCGRCHVVDDRNRMGGIGSTPSFAALRGRPDWSDLFRAFWSQNPHPSFTEVEGLTDHDPDGPVPHVAPVRITLEEIEAITAFVATIKPKNLGRPVQSN